MSDRGLQFQSKTLVFFARSESFPSYLRCSWIEPYFTSNRQRKLQEADELHSSKQHIQGLCRMQLHHFLVLIQVSCVCVCSAELLITALLFSYYTLSPFSTLAVHVCRAASHCNTTLVRLIGPYSSVRTKSGMCCTELMRPGVQSSVDSQRKTHESGTVQMSKTAVQQPNGALRRVQPSTVGLSFSKCHFKSKPRSLDHNAAHNNTAVHSDRNLKPLRKHKKVELFHAMQMS